MSYARLRMVLEAARPPILEESQTRGLSLRADGLVKLERLGDGVVCRRRVRANLLELADVVSQLHVGGSERPYLRDQRLPHVEEAGTDGREQPLVQARAVHVALEVGQREREVREGVRSVHDRPDPPRSCRATDVIDREDLTRQVRDVAEVDHLRLPG